MIKTIKFNTIKELLNFIAPWNDELSLKGYIFRGQSQEEYELIPSALRVDNINTLWNAANIVKPVDDQLNYIHWQVIAEYNALRNFYNLADRKGLQVPILNKFRWSLAQKPDAFTCSHTEYEKAWLPQELFEIAALAQHYGLPTRLLDWSYDPYIALYFALTGSFDKSGNMVIWAFNKDYTRLQNTIGSKCNVDFITPHYESNPNLYAQKGLFTHVSSFNQPSNEVFEALGNNHSIQKVDRTPLDTSILQSLKNTKIKPEVPIFIKLVLPCSEAQEGIRLLELLGYDTAKVYPGYAGVAKQIVEQRKYINVDENDRLSMGIAE